MTYYYNCDRNKRTNKKKEQKKTNTIKNKGTEYQQIRQMSAITKNKNKKEISIIFFLTLVFQMCLILFNLRLSI